MAFAKSKKIGRSPGSPHLLVYTTINGTSIAQGDASDTVGNFSITERSTEPQMRVGLGDDDIVTTTASWRMLPLVFIPLVDVVPAFSRIFRAVLYVMFPTGDVRMPADTVPGGQVAIDWFGLRRVYVAADVNFEEYSSGNLWGEFAGEIGVDTTLEAVGTLPYTQTDYDAQKLQSSVQYFFKGMDIKSEIQYRVDRNENAQLIGYLNNFGSLSGSANTAKVFTIGRLNNSTTERSYLDIFYVPPIVLHSALATAGRAIDMANVLDAESLESIRHLYMGFVDQGETGDPVKYWVRNTRTDRVARRLVIEATRSFANTPARRATNSTAKTLRSVDCYDLHLDVNGDVDELTPRGAWYIEAISTTQYKLMFQADFTGSFVQMATSLNFASDNTITDTSYTPDRKILRIRALKWDTGLAAAATDKWDFETAVDTTKPEYPLDSKPMMSFMPATTSAGDTPQTAEERPVSGGITARLRSSTYDYDDSGTDRSVILLPDTEIAGYSVGEKYVIFDGTGSEVVEIHAILDSNDALPTGAPGGEVGDAVVLTDVLSRAYAAGAYFTPGLYIDELAKSEDAFVEAGGALAGQALIDLTVAQSWTAGNTITVINFSTGQTAQYVIQAMLNGGLRVQTSANLSFALTEGDMVVKAITANTESFFMRGTVPEGATLGDRLALMRCYEARSSLQNIL
jgi:hypothetical protein